MHLLSAWDGTPKVDAHAPVGLELANYCRQPKTFKLWVKTHQCCMASDGVPMGPLHHHIGIDPVQRRWRWLPVGVTWGPPHLPLPILHRKITVLMGKVQLSGFHSANNTRPFRDTAGEQPQCGC